MIQRSCDRCNFSGPGIERFGLRRQIWRRDADGVRRHTTEGVGSFDLCPRCLQIALDRRRPHKRGAFAKAGTPKT